MNESLNLCPSCEEDIQKCIANDCGYGYCNSCGDEWNLDLSLDCPNPDCDGDGEWTHWADDF